MTPSGLGGLLTRAMHDEDSHWGLNMTNTTSNAWRAYGDKRYFDRSISRTSAWSTWRSGFRDEVFGAFNTGTVPQPANYLALTRIANLTAARNFPAEAAGNISPLFAWNGSTVVRRKDVNNLNDYSWTSDWYGWSTYYLLEKQYNPNTPTGYLQPPTGSPAVSPNGWQSTQSVPPNWIQNAQVRYAVSMVNNL